MKFMHFFLVLSTITSLILDIASFPLEEDQLHYNTDNEVIENFSSHQSRGVSRFLAQHEIEKPETNLSSKLRLMWEEVQYSFPERN
ncbi:hypothetical protein SADUNF_Sadunf10G0177400 [Salix dunnii]|uniref:Uncharacterized protein n=1 Tax=Salix dunnii TaxID=1413687 RepID=A0A835MZ54_9ROSI|nr:hypothetical protein SADUNF_Sadunf10G0177400 [Salix dunnii]